MDVLQFRVMARVLEHVHNWSASTLMFTAAEQVQTGKVFQPMELQKLQERLKKVSFLPHKTFAIAHDMKELLHAVKCFTQGRVSQSNNGAFDVTCLATKKCTYHCSRADFHNEGP
jgi:hypothetical protein